MSAEAEVVAITVEQTHDLRRRVLRAGTPSDDVHFVEDERPETFHLGVRLNDAIVVTSTWTPEDTALAPGRPAWRLRGMATEPALHGSGLGSLVIGHALEQARAAGLEVVWANARDSALTFYQRLGFEVVGDGFITTDTHLPHHVVLKDLTS
jgi:GNAT superfamily N-acetyltransferase